jgi:outer membrane protein OmpA-like peptidoglycan-associated protein
MIQLYNGAAPVLVAPSLSITKAAAVAPAPAPVVGAPKPSPVVVAPTPAPTTPTKPVGGSSAPSTKPLVKTLSLNIYFDMASYAVNTTNRAKLVALAKRIAGLGTNITISITGYAQPTPGSEATDGLLSKRRAAEVAKIMRKYGVNTKVIYKGAGRAAVNDASSRYVEIVAANS